MGYGYYELPTPEGRPMKRGYYVRCKCHEKECYKAIDRGLAFLCYRCTQYFCGEHLKMAFGKDDLPLEADCFAGKSSQMCQRCASELSEASEVTDAL